MDKERAKQLMSLAFIIAANELGLTNRSVSDQELAKMLDDAKVTLEELILLDDYVQNIMEFVADGEDDMTI